ncbi:hypothetical protein [uncultured Acetobacteroides sp.]|uniref:hypothetical protein n=1 Tax=uncultured Acetobacteroides sp. TaxID=1760811 RepID=UPI0029F5287A|nr:hypothetical protein [uncultured Acetobacteroides sp.]
MIVADHLIPLTDSLRNQFAKGSVADKAYFCTGDEQMEDIPAGSIALIFADPVANNRYASEMLALLGQMFPSWEAIKVVVLGNLITSDNNNYNCSSFTEVIEKALKSGLYPIVISSESNYAKIICEVYSRISPLQLGFISPALSSHLPNGLPNLVGMVDDFGLSKDNSISVIANQVYYSDSSWESNMKGTYYQQARLGAIRTAMPSAEPLLRDSNLLFVDLNSVRNSDFSSTSSPTPNGLYAEEICQLMRYAGYSDNLKCMFISGFDTLKLTENEIDITLVAQLLWHALDGLASRKNELPGLTSFLSKEFYLDLGEQEPLTLNFMQSQNTGRWWLYVPTANGAGRWIACDAEDYERAKHHELPYRWICLYNLIG